MFVAGSIDAVGGGFSQPTYSGTYSSSAYKNTTACSSAQNFSSHKQSSEALEVNSTVAQHSALNNFQSPFQSQSAYSSSAATQSSLYPNSSISSSSNSAHSSFPGGANVTSFPTGYASNSFHNRDSQSAAAQSSSSYSSDSNHQAIYNNRNVFGAANVAQKLGGTKLSDTIDSTLEQSKISQSDTAAVVSTVSLPVTVMSSSTALTSPSASVGSVGVSTVLGIPSQSLHNLQISKSSSATQATLTSRKCDQFYRS